MPRTFLTAVCAVLSSLESPGTRGLCVLPFQTLSPRFCEEGAVQRPRESPTPSFHPLPSCGLFRFWFWFRTCFFVLVERRLLAVSQKPGMPGDSWT